MTTIHDMADTGELQAALEDERKRELAANPEAAAMEQRRRDEDERMLKALDGKATPEETLRALIAAAQRFDQRMMHLLLTTFWLKVTTEREKARDEGRLEGIKFAEAEAAKRVPVVQLSVDMAPLRTIVENKLDEWMTGAKRELVDRILALDPPAMVTEMGSAETAGERQRGDYDIAIDDVMGIVNQWIDEGAQLQHEMRKGIDAAQDEVTAANAQRAEQ